MRPESKERPNFRYRAANDNRPGGGKRIVPVVTEWPPRPAAETHGAVPDWLLRSLMILGCAAPIAGLVCALPWIRSLLDG